MFLFPSSGRYVRSVVAIHCPVLSLIGSVRLHLCRLFPPHTAEEVIGSRSSTDANATRWRAEVGCFLLLFVKFSPF